MVVCVCVCYNASQRSCFKIPKFRHVELFGAKVAHMVVIETGLKLMLLELFCMDSFGKFKYNHDIRILKLTVQKNQ